MREERELQRTHLNNENVIVVTLPEQNGKHVFGMPRAKQQGVWSILLAKHEYVMFAHGAQTIKSVISVWSVLRGSHILSTHVWCVIPFLMQHDRMSGNTGTTATFVRDPAVPLSNVKARMRTLGKLDPKLLLAVIDTEYMVNGFKFLITCNVEILIFQDRFRMNKRRLSTHCWIRVGWHSNTDVRCDVGDDVLIEWMQHGHIDRVRGHFIGETCRWRPIDLQRILVQRLHANRFRGTRYFLHAIQNAFECGQCIRDAWNARPHIIRERSVFTFTHILK